MRRDEIDTLRTQYWCLQVKDKLGVGTAYAVEKIIEPKAMGKTAAGEPYHVNKWSKYEKGIHTPSAPLVDKVEAKAPGTRRALDHPLWELLRSWSKLSKTSDINIRLGQLSPEIQAVVFSIDTATGAHTRNKVHGRLINKLAHRMGLDALTCLCLLLREADLLQQRDLSVELGFAIYRALLVLNAAYAFQPIETGLVQLFVDRVFQSAWNKVGRFSFDARHLLAEARELRLDVIAVHDARPIGPTWRDLAKAMYSIVHWQAIRTRTRIYLPPRI
jgi:hypothetical protein